jgi:hypothetical protein
VSPLQKHERFKYLLIKIGYMADPILFDLVNSVYNYVADRIPIMNKSPMLSAPVLGATGTFLAAQAGLYISRRVAEKHPNFSKIVTTGAEIAGLATPLIIYGAFALIDPEGAKSLSCEHPVYLNGMIGAYLGAAGPAVADLARRFDPKKKRLEDKLDALEKGQLNKYFTL